MRTQSYTINLGSNLTTSITDDHWTKTDFEHLECWKKIVGNTVERCFLHRGQSLNISIDFTPAIRSIERRITIMQGLSTATNVEDKGKWISQFNINDIIVHAHLITDYENSLSIDTAHSYTDYMLHDIFLVMNISSPGSCNFYNTHMMRKDPKLENRLGLSNHNFEMAMIDSIESNWPPVHFLSTEDVNRWYIQCRPDLKMLSSNRMERAMFALLHLAKSEISASGVIWIFYALEAIYDTRPGENFRSIYNRTCLILKPNANEGKYLNRKLHELYDIRSAFVHGGLEVAHPMANEVLDKSIEESIYRLMAAIDFGSRLVIASLQRIITEGWVAPNFQEIVS